MRWRGPIAGTLLVLGVLGVLVAVVVSWGRSDSSESAGRGLAAKVHARECVLVPSVFRTTPQYYSCIMGNGREKCFYYVDGTPIPRRTCSQRITSGKR